MLADRRCGAAGNGRTDEFRSIVAVAAIRDPL
jgi:hypothetical protein